MVVYKFGGASVKSAGGIRNLAGIVAKEAEKLVIVISALGKTTNSLEQILNKWFAGESEYKDLLISEIAHHKEILCELIPGESNTLSHFQSEAAKLVTYLNDSTPAEYDFEYDQVVSYGEIWSTIIVSGYLNSVAIAAKWVDIRNLLTTDERYRDSTIYWEESCKAILEEITFKDVSRYITQGFIGGTRAGFKTTLGREGSDYTAAVLANMLDASKVVVWKDVPGLLNADPKWMSNTVILPEVSYKEAVEMTFSGAKVIHPKTIKPLHNKSIPLHVRSFIDPAAKGTIIRNMTGPGPTVPVYVRKENQIMVSILPRDFSFAIGENLSRIFMLLYEAGIYVNMVEASAVSINICADYDQARFENLVENIGADFKVIYNMDVEMLTIRHYTPEAIDLLTGKKEILLEQRARSTVRFVTRDSGEGSAPND